MELNMQEAYLAVEEVEVQRAPRDYASLIAEKNVCQKNKKRALWLAVCSAAGVVGTGVFCFYKIIATAYNPSPGSQDDFSSAKNINLTVGTGCGTLGFFGMYKYARYRMKRNQESLDRINAELDQSNQIEGQAGILTP
jgi:hypothetical protein